MFVNLINTIHCERWQVSIICLSVDGVDPPTGCRWCRRRWCSQRRLGGWRWGEPKSLQRVQVKRDAGQKQSQISSDPKNLTNDLQCLDPLAIAAGDLRWSYEKKATWSNIARVQNCSFWSSLFLSFHLHPFTLIKYLNDHKFQKSRFMQKVPLTQWPRVGIE